MAQVVKLVAPAQPLARSKVAAYARVSTDHDRQVSSIAAQVAYYSRLIQTNSRWEYVGVFCDDGITGTSTAHRQGFNDLMELARGGGVDIVLTKSISRFARNTVDLLETVRELKTLGVAVRFERENIDTLTAEGELLVTLLASFAQAESESNSQAVTWAIRKKYERGDIHSRSPYGYKYVAWNLEIIEKEARIVRLVFDNFLAGITPEASAEHLNAAGVKPRRGAKFNPGTLRRWLENEVYIGNALCQKHYRPGIANQNSKRNDGRLPSYLVENNHEPIIDRATFDAVQAELAKRRRYGRAATPTGGSNALTSLIHCSQCGLHYHRRTRTRKTRSYKFWWCESATKGAGNPCGSAQLREVKIQAACQHALGIEAWDEEAVLDGIEAITAHPNHDLDIHLTTGESVTINLDHVDERGARHD